MLYTHETFLVYTMETFKNSKEVKHIMIMIIVLIYFFLSYVIFDQQLKITFRKSSAPPSPSWKNPFPSKNSKSASLPRFCQHWKFLNFKSKQKKGFYKETSSELIKQSSWASLEIILQYYSYFRISSLQSFKNM